MEYLPWSVGVEMTDPALLASKTACRILGHGSVDYVLNDRLRPDEATGVCKRCGQRGTVERAKLDAGMTFGEWLKSWDWK